MSKTLEDQRKSVMALISAMDALNKAGMKVARDSDKEIYKGADIVITSERGQSNQKPSISVALDTGELVSILIMRYESIEERDNEWERMNLET